MSAAALRPCPSGRRAFTVGKTGKISGKGLHTGQTATVTLSPAAAGTGLSFYRNGRKAEGPSESVRCTAVGSGDALILTVEHLAAALSGLGVTNAKIDVEGPEIPGLDGSSLKFVEWIRGLGLATQDGEAPVYKITVPIFCHDGPGRAILAYPAEGFSVCYTLDYDHPALRAQTVDFDVTPAIFENQIAPARTFCTEAEAATVRQKGLGLGADESNTLVIGDAGPVGNRYRLADECARHKALDLIGDLALLGFRLEGRVVALRSGHALNRRLIEEIKRKKGDHGK